MPKGGGKGYEKSTTIDNTLLLTLNRLNTANEERLNEGKSASRWRASPNSMLESRADDIESKSGRWMLLESCRMPGNTEIRRTKRSILDKPVG